MSQPSSDGQRQPAIVILDFGSQYSELIARRVRETEVFSVVLGYSTTAEELRRIAPKGIILSGGPVPFMPTVPLSVIPRSGSWGSLCSVSATACS